MEYNKGKGLGQLRESCRKILVRYNINSLSPIKEAELEENDAYVSFISIPVLVGGMTFSQGKG